MAQCKLNRVDVRNKDEDEWNMVEKKKVLQLTSEKIKSWEDMNMWREEKNLGDTEPMAMQQMYRWMVWWWCYCWVWEDRCISFPHEARI